MLVGLAGLSSAALVVPRIVRGELPVPDDTPFDARQREILSAAVERLLPGANEAGVLAYMNHWLGQEPFVPVRNYLAHGAKHLDGVSKKKKKKPFVKCSGTAQDEILKMFAHGKVKVGKFNGNTFFQQLMELTLEGFLSDPRYGGNRDRVGWQFVGIPDGLRSCWWNPDGAEMILDPDSGFHD